MTPRSYITLGLSVIPCNAHKEPLTAWKDAQHTITDPGEATHYGIVCGAVSGNLECIDFDLKYDPTGGDAFQIFRELVSAADTGLWKRLLIEQSQSGGRHVVYRCPSIQVPGKQHLAKSEDGWFLELLAEGNYFLCAPSPGYTLLQGSYADVPVLSEAERTLLLDSARALHLNQSPDAEAEVTQRAHYTSTNGYSGGISPLDDYDQRGDFIGLLKKHGWTVTYQRQRSSGLATQYLCRPGKQRGVSASFNHIPDRLYVFTTSTQFDSNRTYRPSAAYAILEHNGDFKKAARQLVADGYGTKGTRAPQVRHAEPTPTDDSEPLQAETIAEYAWQQQYGDAQLFTYLMSNTIAYDATEEAWYIFDCQHRPGHWLIDRRRAILTLCVEALIDAYAYARDIYKQREKESDQTFTDSLSANGDSQTNVDRKEANNARVKANKAENASDMLTKRITALRSVRYTKAVLEFARSMNSIEGTEWDHNPMLLGVANGVIDLNTGQLRNAVPTDYLRRIAPTAYDPAATAPRWYKFISEIFDEDPFGDAPITDYMQRLLGYGLTGLNTQHVYPILHGAEGRNGKDTLLDALMHVLGRELAKPVSADTVISSGKRNSGSATPELYQLRGVRYAWVNETDEADRMKVGQLKQLSGGTIISCRPLHGNMIEFEPTHLIMLATNFKPSAPAHDEALWARIALIPFKMRFIDHPEKPNERLVDRTLKETLRSEAQGILRWLVHGTARYLSEGLLMPDAVKASTAEFRLEQDTFADWWNGNVILEKMATCKAGDAYKNYKDWCISNGMWADSLRVFSDRIKSRNIETHRGTGGAYFYRGMDIKGEPVNTMWGSN